ncbi:hypothetical protein HDU86_005092 [Geranomyces michiganensis]|nr:hypothetical protein HDU86_005092 [Geranomyces michiganensis]
MFKAGSATPATRAKLAGAPRPGYFSLSSLQSLRAGDSPQQQDYNAPLDSIEAQRAGSENRLRRAWEDIIQRYSRDFDDADEIDITTCEIVVDNGWVRGLGPRPAFGTAVNPVDPGDGDAQSDCVDEGGDSSSQSSGPGGNNRRGIWDEVDPTVPLSRRSPPAEGATLGRHELEDAVVTAENDCVDDKPASDVDSAFSEPCGEETMVGQSLCERSPSPPGDAFDDFIISVPLRSDIFANFAHLEEDLGYETDSALGTDGHIPYPLRHEGPEIEILFEDSKMSAVDVVRKYDAFREQLLLTNAEKPCDAKDDEPCKEETAPFQIPLDRSDVRQSRDSQDVLTQCGTEIDPIIIEDDDEGTPIKPEYQTYTAHAVQSTIDALLIVIEDDGGDAAESTYSMFKHKLSGQDSNIKGHCPVTDNCDTEASASPPASFASCESEPRGCPDPDPERPPPAPPNPSSSPPKKIVLRTSPRFCTPTPLPQLPQLPQLPRPPPPAPVTLKRKRVVLGSLTEGQRRRGRSARAALLHGL